MLDKMDMTKTEAGAYITPQQRRILDQYHEAVDDGFHSWLMGDQEKPLWVYIYERLP